MRSLDLSNCLHAFVDAIVCIHKRDRHETLVLLLPHDGLKKATSSLPAFCVRADMVRAGLLFQFVLFLLLFLFLFLFLLLICSV